MSKGRIRVESTRRGYMKRFLIQEKGGEKVNCKRKEEIRKKKRKAMLHYGIKELKQVTSCGSKEGEKYLREIPNLFINNSTCVKYYFFVWRQSMHSVCCINQVAVYTCHCLMLIKRR